MRCMLLPVPCFCAVQALGILIMLLIGVVLPTFLAWRSEYKGKARFLRAQGKQLRLRAPAPVSWALLHLRMSASAVPGRGYAFAVSALAGLPLAWLLSEVLLLAASATCRAGTQHPAECAFWHRHLAELPA
jgi:hypothetical protein